MKRIKFIDAAVYVIAFYLMLNFIYLLKDIEKGSVKVMGKEYACKEVK